MSRTAAGLPESGRAVRLASIHIYPMKATRAVDLAESLVEPWGLAGDRRWLLVDEDARFVSQREEPSLARVTVTYGPGCRGDQRVGAGAARRPGARARGRRGTAEGVQLALGHAGGGRGPGGRRVVLGLSRPSGAPGVPGRPDPACAWTPNSGRTGTW